MRESSSRRRESTGSPRRSSQAPLVENDWSWNADSPIPWQETYNLEAPEADGSNSLYFSCDKQASTILRAEEANGASFVKYDGETGVTLVDEQLLFPATTQAVCLIRTFGGPIDLTMTTRVELNVKTAGQGAPCGAGNGTCAPWFAVWLAPMVYDWSFDNTFSAEINLVENHALDAGNRSYLYNHVHSSYPDCDNTGEDHAARNKDNEYCKMLRWDVPATALNHHITVKVSMDDTGARLVKVWHCENAADGDPQPTCTGSRAECSRLGEVLLRPWPHPRNIHIMAAASPRPASAEDLHGISHVMAAASPRPASAEDLHRISTSWPRRRRESRDPPPQDFHGRTRKPRRYRERVRADGAPGPAGETLEPRVGPRGRRRLLRQVPAGDRHLRHARHGARVPHLGRRSLRRVTK